MYEKKSWLEKILNCILDCIEKKIVLIFCLFIIIILYIFYKYIKIINDQNFYYYLFSTIIQGFLALVGVLGAAIIYKVQLIENNLNLVKERAILKIKILVSRDYCENSWVVVKNEIDERAIIQPACQDFVNLSDEFGKLAEHRSLVIKDITRFSLIAFINVGMAILGLPLSVFLINNKQFIPISLFAFVNIIFSFYLLFFSFKMIKTVFAGIRRK